MELSGRRARGSSIDIVPISSRGSEGSASKQKLDARPEWLELRSSGSMQVWAITYDPDEFTDQVRIKFLSFTLYINKQMTSSMRRACHLWISNLRLASRDFIAGRMLVVRLINVYKRSNLNLSLKDV